MIHKVIINKQFSCFLKKHENVILELFNKLKNFKEDIQNTYEYSLIYPPKRKNYKYTDKLYLDFIHNFK